jgi:hypothetical protein
VRLRRVVFVAFCALFLVLAAARYPSVTAHAGTGFQPVSPEELKMTSEPLAPGAPAIILYREVYRDDRNWNSTFEDRYYRIKILTEAGRQYANIEIPFSKDVDAVAHIRARTIKPDGTIVDFDNNVLESEKVTSRAVKTMVRTFTLPAVEPGCILEYSYTLQMRGLRESHWIVSEPLFTKSAHFSLIPYPGLFQASFRLRWTDQNLPPGAQTREGSGRVIRMEASNIPGFQTEDHMPPPNQMKSRVDFVYDSGVLETDPDKYWKQVGKAQNERLESFVGSRGPMEKAVTQIVLANDSPEAKLRKIYARVQQIRDTSFELQKTRQEVKREKEKVDEHAEDVWKRGYGNKWQLDWLFLALVRAAGFEAYGCWVSRRDEYFFNPKAMQGGHLSQTAVLVKLNGQDMFFNPGAEFAPFGLLNWSETGTPALRLDKDGGTWIKTPLPASSESRIERKARLKLSDTGDLEGKLTITYTGLEAMYHRIDMLHSDGVARKKFLEDRVKTQIPVAVEAELINQPDWNASETPLAAEFDVKIPSWASHAGKRVIIPAAVFTAGEKHTFEHANRNYPIYFEYPHEKVDDLTIELPSGWQVGSVPPPQEKDVRSVGYTLKVDAGKDTVHLTRTFKVDFMILESKYYPTLRDFFQLVRTGDEQQIVLQPGAATASN